MNVNEDLPHTMGVISENTETKEIELKTMADKLVTCIAKNYKVDKQVKDALEQSNKAGVKSFNAPNEQADPIYMSL
jgi:hypothetical protein